MPGANSDFETREFQAPDGVRLVADVGGPLDAPTVILLHGGGQTRHSWSGSMKALMGAGYRVINFDARGHGDSDWSDKGAYSISDRAMDLETLCKEAGDRFAVVGASLGGATIIRAIADGLHPSAAVFVDITPDPEEAGVTRVVDFMSSHPEGFADIEEAADAVAAYNPARPRPNDPSGLRKNLREGDDGRLRWHWDPRIVTQRVEEHRRDVRDAAEALAELTHIPVMLVRGLLSDIVSERSVESFRRMVPRLEVFDVAGAGHMVAGDRNDHFSTGVIEFLKRNMPA